MDGPQVAAGGCQELNTEERDGAIPEIVLWGYMQGNRVGGNS